MINAKKAYQDKKFDEAVKLFSDIYQKQPANLDVLEGLARSSYQLKNFNDAIKYCNQALLIETAIVWPYLIRSYIHFLQKEIDICKEDARTAIELAPSNWEPNFWWGSLLDYENKTSESLVFLEKAASLEFNELSLYNNLSRAYFKQGDLKKYYGALKEMNRLRPRFLLSLSIHFGELAIFYSLFTVLIHYSLIVFSWIMQLNLLLIIPGLIDLLVTISGFYTIKYRRKPGVVLILFGLLNFAIIVRVWLIIE